MTIVVVANQKGGTGKTTTSVNLAHHLKANIIVDLDIHKGISNINSLSSNPVEILQPKTQNELISILEMDNDGSMIIIDCGGYDGDMIRIVLANADFIITPSSDDPTEQFALSEYNKVLREISKSAGTRVTANVLINRVHPSRTAFIDFVSLINNLEHVQLLPVQIPQSALITKAMFQGGAVKSGTVAAKYKLLAEHIKKHTSTHKGTHDDTHNSVQLECRGDA